MLVGDVDGENFVSFEVIDVKLKRFSSYKMNWDGVTAKCI